MPACCRQRKKIKAELGIAPGKVGTSQQCTYPEPRRGHTRFQGIANSLMFPRPHCTIPDCGVDGLRRCNKVLIKNTYSTIVSYI